MSYLHKAFSTLLVYQLWPKPSNSSTGAEGILQAIILSLGGLKFLTVKEKVQHMEFNADPADLHRDYEFVNVRYGDLTLLNVSVIVDENNFAVLHLSSEKDGLYACDASLAEIISIG